MFDFFLLVYSALYFLVFFVLGLLYANIAEWVIHKYILHGLGKKPKGTLANKLFSFHWRIHHRNSRKNNFFDEDYLKPTSSARLKETIGLFILWLSHSWLFILFPLLSSYVFFFFGITFSIVLYYVVHEFSHLNPVWAKKYLRWHYDHHMGKNQDANYCVTWPMFDYIMNTRIFYSYKKRKNKKKKDT